MIFHNKLKGFSLLIMLLTTACSDDQSGRKKHSAPVHQVKTATAINKPISIEKTLPGTLEAFREVQIFNQQEGPLTTLKFHEGDQVKQGDIIATLDDALIQANLNKTQATYRQSKLDLKRLKNLAKRKLASDDEIAKTQTILDIAQADLDLNKIKLTHTKITAPFDGIISQRLAEPGNIIPLHSHLLSLIDTSSLKTRIYVSELLLPLIQQNDQVEIKIDALGDQLFNGQVIRHHPTIDANTRRGIIEVSLKPVPEGAVPGQLSRVTLKTANKIRLMIPFDAVRHDSTGAYVYTIEDNKAKQIYIRTGVQSHQEIEILEGIEENGVVIVNGFFGLKNSKPVTVKNK
jgi:membrane fusion protein, multidrug efflux system